MLWCLHDDDVCALAGRFDGPLINTSKQSRTTIVLFLNEYLKHCDIVRHKSSPSGQLINGASRTSSATMQAKKYPSKCRKGDIKVI